MLKNYLLIALRHLSRHRLFATINIFCLSIGIAICLLIANYVIQEKQVNAGLRNVNHQYVLKSKWKVKDMGLPFTVTAPLPKALANSYPALVRNFYRFNPVTTTVTTGTEHFKENIAICDTTLISMYGFRLLHGDPEHAFLNTKSAVITEELARRLFGTTNVLGKTITINNTTQSQQDYTVSAVLATMPRNTVNQLVDRSGYNMFVPFEGNRFFQSESYIDDWANAYIIGMIELTAGTDPKALNGPTKDLLTRHMPDNLKGLVEVELAAMRTYYQKDNDGAVEQMITMLSMIAGFILLMAVINFINISIGTSGYRLKEMGLRKVFGGRQRQLIIQYLVESVVLTIIAALIAFMVHELTRPLFSQILGTTLQPIWQLGLAYSAYIAGSILLLGLIAGFYPAFILASSAITKAVKGTMNTARGGLILRKSLLAVQFTLAIFIFISALNVARQVEYFFNKNVGYDREQLLVITAFPKQWDSSGVLKMESIRDHLAQLPVVKSATISFEIPDRLPPLTTDLLPENNKDNRPVVVPSVSADQHYAATFGIHMEEGSFLSGKEPTQNETEIVLNESAVRALGLSTRTGAIVSMPGGYSFRVTGIVKDFNFSSFHQKIGPLAFIPTKLTRTYRYLTLKLNSHNTAAALATIKNNWQKFSPGSPFEYNFMDEKFASLYESELKLKKAANIATGLNMVIVFMGIFGIVAFTLARRTREIALRKVLGAGVHNILLLFVRDYAVLIILANIIAWPLAYLATDSWLQNYAYRMEPSLTPYLVVGIIITISVFAFVSLQCLHTALTSPVKNLRSE